MQKDEIRDRLADILWETDLREMTTVWCGTQRNATFVKAGWMMERGVTVQEWIPVDERKPELIPCNAGTAYSEAVNVLTSGRKVMTAIWDGTNFICPMDFWDAWGEEITHWTPVLLPLPEPPKEVE